MFTISNQTDYAMLFLEYLAARDGAVSLSHVVSDLKLPRRFMAHVAAKLVAADILESREGINGGYKLTKPLDNIRLYDLLRIFEGELALVKCSDREFQCRWEKNCRHKKHWKHMLTDKFLKVLNSMTIADVIKKETYTLNQ